MNSVSHLEWTNCFSCIASWEIFSYSCVNSLKVWHWAAGLAAGLHTQGCFGGCLWEYEFPLITVIRGTSEASLLHLSLVCSGLLLNSDAGLWFALGGMKWCNKLETSDYSPHASAGLQYKQGLLRIMGVYIIGGEGKILYEWIYIKLMVYTNIYYVIM